MSSSAPSAPPSPDTSTSHDSPARPGLKQLREARQQCFACRVIGTAALGGVGVYALGMSRASAPGTPLGKRIVGGIGIGFLLASYFRWNTDMDS